MPRKNHRPRRPRVPDRSENVEREPSTDELAAALVATGRRSSAILGPLSTSRRFSGDRFAGPPEVIR